MRGEIRTQGVEPELAARLGDIHVGYPELYCVEIVTFPWKRTVSERYELIPETAVRRERTCNACKGAGLIFRRSLWRERMQTCLGCGGTGRIKYVVKRPGEKKAKS